MIIIKNVQAPKEGAQFEQQLEFQKFFVDGDWSQPKYVFMEVEICSHNCQNIRLSVFTLKLLFTTHTLIWNK